MYPYGDAGRWRLNASPVAEDKGTELLSEKWVWLCLLDRWKGIVSVDFSPTTPRLGPRFAGYGSVSRLHA